MRDILELSISRHIQATPETVYRVWTERTAEWWAPKPWTTRVVEQDLRAGGRGTMEMRGPNGECFPHEGVFLEVVPNRRIVSTNVFGAGWEPRTLMTSECDFATLAIFSFEADGAGTRYTGRARHWDAAAKAKHEEMGFEQGWSICAAQLAELAEAEENGTRAAA